MTATFLAAGCLGGKYHAALWFLMFCTEPPLGLFIMPQSISRLPPYPVTFSTSKPASISWRLTFEAAVKVENVALFWLSSAIARNNEGCHIAGFLLGENPSKNHASTNG